MRDRGQAVRKETTLVEGRGQNGDQRTVAGSSSLQASERYAQAGRVVLVQSTIPAYRLGLIEVLAHHLGERLRVLAGREYFDPTIRLDAVHENVQLVSNRFLCGRRLLWQHGAWRAATSADSAIVELNPRILSTWLILLTRRLARRPTVVWGHAWPRSGRAARSEPLRHAMRRLATAVVTYTDTQARELRQKMPSALIASAPNALYSSARAPAPGSGADASSFVFVGRLVPAKKPMLLLEAFLAAIDELPDDASLVFVGEGPLRSDLEARAAGLEDRIRLRGPVWRFEDLEQVYADALVSVSPGYVGLSLTQSLWFGVPALVARTEPHSPEIEAAVEGENAEFFESDSVEALRAALIRFSRNRDSWRERRAAIAAACVNGYSLEVMADSLLSVVAEVRRER